MINSMLSDASYTLLVSPSEIAYGCSKSVSFERRNCYGQIESASLHLSIGPGSVPGKTVYTFERCGDYIPGGEYQNVHVTLSLASDGRAATSLLKDKYPSHFHPADIQTHTQHTSLRVQSRDTAPEVYDLEEYVAPGDFEVAYKASGCIAVRIKELASSLRPGYSRTITLKDGTIIKVDYKDICSVGSWIYKKEFFVPRPESSLTGNVHLQILADHSRASNETVSQCCSPHCALLSCIGMSALCIFFCGA